MKDEVKDKVNALSPAAREGQAKLETSDKVVARLSFPWVLGVAITIEKDVLEAGEGGGEGEGGGGGRREGGWRGQQRLWVLYPH